MECGEHLEKQNEEGYKEEHIECNKAIAPLGEIKGELFKQRDCYKRITVVTQYEEIEQAARSLGVNVYINPHPVSYTHLCAVKCPRHAIYDLRGIYTAKN